jgi:adhesin transport system membrane fusion protein
MSFSYSEEMPIARSRYSLVLWVLVAGFAISLIWASIFRIEESTRGNGTVIASSRVQVIQSVDGGVLEELRVKEGDIVKKGQILAILEQTRFASPVKELDSRIAALNAKIARLRAEVTGADKVNFPESATKFPELIKVQRALFVQKKQGIDEELRTLSVSVDLAREDTVLVKNLAKTGDVSHSEVIQAERMLNDADGKLINRRNKYFQDARIELAKAEDEIGQAEQVRNQRNQQLQDSVFKAPVAGIVKNVRITTQGGVLRSGEELMQIVPINDLLIVETKIKPADIADLRPGLSATIRFDAFDSTIYGSVNGEVSYISADTLKEETRGVEETYYRVHVAIPGKSVMTHTGKQLDIFSGMTALVDIKTGDRTVLAYILKPLRKTLSDSFRER